MLLDINIFYSLYFHSDLIEMKKELEINLCFLPPLDPLLYLLSVHGKLENFNIEIRFLRHQDTPTCVVNGHNKRQTIHFSLMSIKVPWVTRKLER